MKVFYNPVQRKHMFKYEIWSGKKTGAFEKETRLDSILKKLTKAGVFDFIMPETLPMTALEAVHRKDYLEFLESTTGIEENHFIWSNVFPYDSRLPMQLPANFLHAGYYSFDIETPIMRHTWESALASASCAYAAAVCLHETSEISYALCRPPGHHATKFRYGGYCYLNNAAIAAQYLSQFGKVLLFDFDFHHGNGTQSIFYDNSKVFYFSIHGHPRVCYPYFSGFETEIGIDEGEGYNCNVPLLPNETGSEEFFNSFLSNLEKIYKKFSPDYIVASAGFDIQHDDPLGHFNLIAQDFYRLGAEIAKLHAKTVIIQEGGYLVKNLGINVQHFLQGIKDHS
jgi:acetoin utilization deacetylase AcuC-like enzyme